MEIVYTTKQLADMLHVCEETVRRWVRDGKLKVEPSRSKKEGNLIKENDLIGFLINNPKYAAMVTDNFTRPIEKPADILMTSINNLISALKDAIDELNIEMEKLIEMRELLKNKEGS